MNTDRKVGWESTLVTSIDEPLGSTGAECVDSLTASLNELGSVTDRRALLAAVMSREAIGSTVLPSGVAIPHALSHAVTTPSLALATLPRPVEFSNRNSADVVILWVSPPSAGREQFIGILHRLLTLAVRPEIRSEIKQDDVWRQLLAEGLR